MPAGAFAHFHNYGPASFAIVVEGGEDPVIVVSAFARLGVQTEGGAQEPSLHGTLLVGNGVEIEGIGELEAFGLRGDIFIGVDVDIAAQPTVFDIVQGVLNAVASQYNISGTIGNKINSASAAGDPWSADLSSYGIGTAGYLMALQAKIARNKMITDPSTGVLTVFDDDGVTPLLTANIFKDAAGTTPYDGTGAERRERLA